MIRMRKPYLNVVKTFPVFLLIMLMALPGFAQFVTGSFNASSNRTTQQMMNAYHEGRDHGRKMRGFLGYDVGAFFSFSDFNYQHVFDNPDATSGYEKTVTLKSTLSSRRLGFQCGSYVILGMMSENSALAFDWGLVGMYSGSETGDMVMPSGSR